MNIIFENDSPKGSFWANKKKLNFCFCRRILENYWQPLLNNMILFQKFIYFVSVSFSLWNLKLYEDSLQHISRLTMKLPLWHTLHATTKRGHWTIKLELLKALWFASCLFPIDHLYFKSILVLLFTQSPSLVWHKRVKACKIYIYIYIYIFLSIACLSSFSKIVNSGSDCERQVFYPYHIMCCA